MPASWTTGERGQHLRLMLRRKGIDPDRLFTMEYYPQRGCWLLTQAAEPAKSPESTRGAAALRPEAFYAQTAAELRRTAVVAFAALASQSPHVALLGRKYQLPPEPQLLTPADLVDLIGGDARHAAARFDSEGGWQPPCV
jgi:hypothetical protein